MGTDKMVHLTNIAGGYEVGRIGARIPRPYSPYPIEYNARVHGPYDPARTYGKPRVPLWDVKIGDMPRFLWNANWSFRNVSRVTGLFWHRYAQRNMRRTNATFTFAWQMVAVVNILCWAS